jgi:hypothetical protein
MIQSDRPGGEQTGRSQRTQKLEIAELNPQRASSSRDFLCRIWYLCWNLTFKAKATGAKFGQNSDAVLPRLTRHGPALLEAGP